MTKVCSKCKEAKDLSDYYLQKEKYEAECKTCRKLRSKSNFNSATRKKQREYYSKNKEKILTNRKRTRTSTLEGRISTILSRSKNHKLGCNLDKGFLINLFHEQKGLCALSGESLEISGDSYLSNLLSLDRISSDKGYQKDNVQWVCVKYNMMKAHAAQEDFITMCKQVARYNT